MRRERLDRRRIVKMYVLLTYAVLFFGLISVEQALLDLMGEESASSSAPIVNQQSTRDLLADIFGAGDESSQAAAPAPAGKSSVNDILGLFGSDPPSSSSQPAAPQQQSQPPQPPTTKTFTAYEGNGLRITLAPAKDSKSPNVTNFLATFTATTAGGVQNINFQAAVPKVGSFCSVIHAIRS